MNSDDAAAVRDSINGCPTVVGDEDIIEGDGEPHEPLSGLPRKLMGNRLEPKRSHFRPAEIQQSGRLGNGDGAERPVYVVVLEPLWMEQDTAISIPQEVVYEVAKHNCRLRLYPPEHRLGPAIWVVDHFREQIDDADGDRCPDCGSTYFKIRDGEPECAKCGATAESAQTKLTEVSG